MCTGQSSMDASAALLKALAALPRAERLAHVRAVGPMDAVVEGLVELVAHSAMGETGSALDHARIITDLSDDTGLTALQARIRHIHARSLSYAGRYDEALEVCRAAVEIGREHGHYREAGRAHLASMHALVELGRMDQAIMAGRDARAMFAEVDDAAMAARADINLGITLLRQDNPEASLVCLDRAQPVVADEPVILGHLQNSRGEAMVGLNRFADAARAFTAARAAFDQEGATLPAAIAEGNLGDLAARRGRLAAALKHFELARRRLEQVDSPVHLARLMAEQAEAQATLGLPDEAMRDYQIALVALDQHGLKLEAARARASLGRLLLRAAGDTAQAETALAAAATAFDELGHHAARAGVELIRARIMARHGQFDAARKLAHRAHAELTDRPAESAAARLMIAQIALEAGDIDQARGELAAAEAEAAPLDIAPLLAEVHHTRGLVERAAMDHPAAIDAFRGAIDQIERIRGSLQADRFRAALLGGRVNAYEQLIDTLLSGEPQKQRHIDEAFHTAERSRSRTLLDQIAIDHHGDDRFDRGVMHDDPVALLSDELNALYSRLADMHLQQPHTAVALRQRIHEVERTLSTAESRRAATDPLHGGLARPVTAGIIADHLPPHTAMIHYVVHTDHLSIFVVRPGAPLAVRTVTDAASLREAMLGLRFQINRGLNIDTTPHRRQRRIADTQRVLGAFHKVLIDPVADLIRDSKVLVVVASDWLHGVPFAALHDGEMYLAERAAVVMIPSASVYTMLQQRAAPDPARPMVVIGAGDDRAPGLEMEAKVVSKLGASRGRTVVPLIGDAATRQRALDHMDAAGVLHIATHGWFDPLHRAASGLKLADGWLTLRDIAGATLTAEMVVLSGCQTGQHRHHAGDEGDGLVRALLGAGARRLLVSLWEVPDAAAQCFIESFYRHHAESPTDDWAQCTRAAQHATMKTYPHPAAWSALMQVGLP